MSSVCSRIGSVFVAVSTAPPARITNESDPSPRTILSGSGKPTEALPASSSSAEPRKTSAPSRRATAVTVASVGGAPPSARSTASSARTSSPGP